MMDEKIIHFEEDMQRLLSILPDKIQLYLRSHDDLNQLYEIVMDIGHPPSIRFDGKHERLDSFSDVSPQDLDHVVSQLGHLIPIIVRVSSVHCIEFLQFEIDRTKFWAYRFVLGAQ